MSRVRVLDELVGAVVEDHAVVPEDVLGADVEAPRLGIPYRTAPVGAAFSARQLQSPAQRGRREQRAEPVVLHLGLCQRLDFRRQVVGILERDALPREWWR